VREARVGVAHTGGERVHDLGLDAVGEVAAVGHVLEAAPAIGDLLVLGERVGDQSEQTHVLGEHVRQRFRGRLALLLVGVGQKVERQLQRHRLGRAFDVETQPGHGLVEQAVPRPRRLALLVEQPLDRLVELVGLLLAHVVEPRLVVRHALVLHGLDQNRVVDLVELQLEEDDVGGDNGQLLGDVAVELGARDIGLITSVVEPGKRPEPPHQLHETLELRDRLSQHGAVARQLHELAVVGLFELACERSRGVQIAGDFRRVGSGVEIGQAPLGQVAELAGGRGGFLQGAGRDVQRTAGAQNRCHRLLQIGIVSS
jgi:hypothetical protein